MQFIIEQVVQSLKSAWRDGECLKEQLFWIHTIIYYHLTNLKIKCFGPPNKCFIYFQLNKEIQSNSIILLNILKEKTLKISRLNPHSWKPSFWQQYEQYFLRHKLKWDSRTWTEAHAKWRSTGGQMYIIRKTEICLKPFQLLHHISPTTASVLIRCKLKQLGRPPVEKSLHCLYKVQGRVQCFVPHGPSQKISPHRFFWLRYL